MTESEQTPGKDLRVRNKNGLAIRPEGRYVVYWMIASRRAQWNFALDRAVALARELDRPLVVLEALRVDYNWASARLHRFVLEGMADNALAFEKSNVRYYPYVEPEVGAGHGLLTRLAEDACAVVTDDFPAFFLPRMVQAAANKIGVRLETVDSNGILPMRAADRVFTRAFDFRRFLQRELAPHLENNPRKAPLRTALRPCPELPAEIRERWPAAEPALLDGDEKLLARLPIDHSVQPTRFRGGTRAGRRTLDEFFEQRIERYGEDRNQPESDGSSGLSPYLHFGHISAHEVLAKLAASEQWTPDRVTNVRSGKRSGWWGMSVPGEAFLDQLVTWREIGFNFCAQRTDYDRYDSLPLWARNTLAEHAEDPRPHCYSLRQFEEAQTHDDLWNAAQNQLRYSGRMHNYLRMLWGKKVLHWSKSPEDALSILIELNNKYAVDGRNPNSYSGIFWVFGRNDRAWGPEREVFGKIRYMSSDNTRRKLRVKEYIERWSEGQPSLF